MVGDEVPVGDVEHRRQRVAAQRGAAEDLGPQGRAGADRGEHQEQGGEKAPGPADQNRPRAMVSLCRHSAISRDVMR